MSEKGFSIVEILVAVTILLIIIIGTVPLMTTSVEMVHLAGEKDQETYKDSANIDIFQAQGEGQTISLGDDFDDFFTIDIEKVNEQGYEVDEGEVLKNTEYNYGEVAEITASAAPGYQFKEWEVVDGDEDIIDTKYVTTIRFPVYENMLLNAIFEEKTYTVTVDYEVQEGFLGGDLSDMGGIDSSSELSRGTHEIRESEEISIRAEAADTGYKFVGWFDEDGNQFTSDLLYDEHFIYQDLDLIAVYKNNRLFWDGNLHVTWLMWSHPGCGGEHNFSSYPNGHYNGITERRRMYRYWRAFQTASSINTVGFSRLYIHWSGSTRREGWFFLWTANRDLESDHPHGSFDGGAVDQMREDDSVGGIDSISISQGNYYIGAMGQKGMTGWPGGEREAEITVYRVWLE